MVDACVGVVEGGVEEEEDDDDDEIVVFVASFSLVKNMWSAVGLAPVMATAGRYIGVVGWKEFTPPKRRIMFHNKAHGIVQDLMMD